MGAGGSKTIGDLGQKEVGLDTSDRLYDTRTGLRRVRHAVPTGTHRTSWAEILRDLGLDPHGTVGLGG